MAKILLVEDDNNLREIYEARLQAEGYTIVSAHDGEEALVVAKAEKPDLIISDVMMPKISGFEMLDILRNTESLKDVKVMMLTALGQNDDQERADKLGADRYLVKSQVTLEDIVNVANELLNNVPAPAVSPTPAPEPATVPEPTTPTDITSPAEPAASTPSEPASPVVEELAEPVAPTEPTFTPPEPATVPEPPTPTDITSPAEPAASAPSDDVPADSAESTDQEQSEVKSQIESFMNSQLSENEGPASTEPAPHNVPEAPAASADSDSTTSQISSSSTGLSPAPSNEEEVTNVNMEAGDVGAPTSSATAASEMGHLGGNKVIEPLPDTEEKPDINQLLQKEEAKDIVSSAAQEAETPHLSAQDTAPTPVEPVISPEAPQ